MNTQLCLCIFHIFLLNHTDRGRLVDTSWEMQTEFSTPDLKDGFQIDVYVDPNLIEVFVNDGEYIISNCVYNLGTDIHNRGM